MAFTTVTGSNGVTSLVGTSGIDVATIVTLSSNVFVGGQGANDVITEDLAGPTFAASNYTVNGGAGDDAITFNNTVLSSVINGDGGTGTAGNDTIVLGEIVINSAVNGGSGNDFIGGFAGGFATYSNSTVNGNAGDDTINVGASSATSIYGGQDSDTITTLGNSSAVLINGNKGSDSIELGASAFTTGTIYGGNGNDFISAAAITGTAGALGVTAAGVFLSGDLGDDTITGSKGIDTINGVDGADVIDGGTGADVIDGGAGNDTVTGGAGGDSIVSGAGNNVYVYTTLTDATVSGNSGFDTITGFSANTSATTNGDRFAVNTLPGAADIFAISFAGDATSTQTASTNLQTALSNNVEFGAGDDVSLVTITGAFSYSGLYMVINADGNAGFYNNQTDAVVKLNTLANIGVNTFTTIAI